MRSYALAVPSVAGSLESYIQAVNSFPILTQEEEKLLARRFRQENDLPACVLAPASGGCGCTRLPGLRIAAG